MEYYHPPGGPTPSLQSAPGLKGSLLRYGLKDGRIYGLEDLFLADFRQKYEDRRFIMGFNDLTKEEQDNLMTFGDFLPFDLNYASPEVQFDLVNDARTRMRHNRSRRRAEDAMSFARGVLSFANNMVAAMADNTRTTLELGFANADNTGKALDLANNMGAAMADNTRTTLDLGFAQSDKALDLGHKTVDGALDLGHKTVDNATLVLQNRYDRSNTNTNTNTPHIENRHRTSTNTNMNTAHQSNQQRAADLLLLHEQHAAIRLKSEKWKAQLEDDGNPYILTQLEVDDRQGSMEMALHFTSEIETLLGKALPDSTAGAHGVISKMKRVGCFSQELINQVGATINVAHGMTTELGVLEKTNLINNGNIIICSVQRQLNSSHMLNPTVIINPFATIAKQPDWFEEECCWYAALQSTDAALRQSQSQNEEIKKERDEAVKERDEAVKERDEAVKENAEKDTKIKMLEHRLEVYEKTVDSRTRKRAREDLSIS